MILKFTSLGNSSDRRKKKREKKFDRKFLEEKLAIFTKQ
jgi:hypothetical protein